MYIASPFVYRAGERFAPGREWLGGVAFLPGAAAIFKGKHLTGIIVIAPGYEATWVSRSDPWDPSDRRVIDRVSLTPLPREAAREELREIGALLDEETLEKNYKDRWSWSLQGEAVEIRLKPKEKELIHSFISRGLSELDEREFDG